MTSLFEDFGINAGFVEEQYQRFLENPQLVHESWRGFFARIPGANGSAQGTNGGSGQPASGTTNGAQSTGSGSGNGGGHAGSAAYGGASSSTFATSSASAFGASSTNASAASPSAAHMQGGYGNAANGANGANGAGAGGSQTDVSRAYAPTSPPQRAIGALERVDVAGLVRAFRVFGHLGAHINPLADAPAIPPILSIERYGATSRDDLVSTGIPGQPPTRLGDLTDHLVSTYCSTVGVELGGVDDETERLWLAQRLEQTNNRRALSQDERRRILTKLTQAEGLEQFLHRIFVGAKRFSVEGGESLIPLLDFVVDDAADLGVEEVVLGMAHRGRLNVLVNLLGKNVRELFAAFKDGKPELHIGSGDVKYHLGFSSDRPSRTGKPVHLTLAFNPSHLEWVNPVVEGRTRAKQDQRGDTERKRVLPLLIHGDAAFMGQGVVTETLNLMGLQGYNTGGTVHIVVNNQVGFTTDATDARSSRYATDIARFLGVPVFHVNGDDPEAVVHVGQVAVEYRQRFGKDVIIDLVCFRKWGHNEGDEPRFTQPQMYAIIDKRPSVRDVYASRLMGSGQVSEAEVKQIVEREKDALAAAFDDISKGDFYPKPNTGGGVWKGFQGGPDANVAEVSTAVARETLVELLMKTTAWPEGFNVNPKVANILRERRKPAEIGDKIDWGTGETLAYASLLAEGSFIRITGQDVRRGTFSHRHAVLRDTQTGQRYAPLSSVATGGARLDIFDSPLSEAGVLGFEYGFSLDSPSALIVWEAQFGDFANTAQVIIDQFLLAAEDKWNRLSGLVLLLPHGYEGAGPEHSSARLERFLQGSAEDNIQVCNLTSPAQIFHALRRQVLRPWRKPLVIMSPKGLLRQKLSSLEDLSEGRFQRVIPDEGDRDPKSVRRILLCSGKVYYDLVATRDELKADDVAIVRLEQLYPLNHELNDALAGYADGTPLVWVQDEPWNMGGWYFVQARLPALLDQRFPLTCVTRQESASPATGSGNAHKIEQKLLLEQAFAREPRPA